MYIIEIIPYLRTMKTPGSQRYKKSKQKRTNKSKTRKLGNLNCHPITHGKTISKHSCFTRDTIIQIRDAYNKQYTKNPIVVDTACDIWKELRKRLPNCNNEDCWVENVQDPSVREYLRKRMFVPKQPASWKDEPKKWLNTTDIKNVLSQYMESHPNFIALGVVPIDFDAEPYHGGDICVDRAFCQFNLQEQIDAGKTKIGAVFNLDKHTGSGTHWVSLFIDVENPLIFFMDSGGEKAPKEVNTFVKRVQEQAKNLNTPIDNMPFIQNHPVEHQQENTECGVYCIHFITTMLTGRVGSRKQINTNDKKIKYFTEQSIPDDDMFKMRKKYFNP